MNASSSAIEARAVRSSRDRIAELLARYPDISPAHVREIIEFLRTGRHLDIGLLTSNEALGPKLDAFMHDHRRHFRLAFRESALAVALIGAFLLLCWLIWALTASGA